MIDIAPVIACEIDKLKHLMHTVFPLIFRQLFDFLNEAEVLLTDSDLLVVCSGYQMNVLFIDPQTCRITGFGSTI